MNERWNNGLIHFSRGNFYAARDFWELEAAEAQNEIEACRVANGLAAVNRQLLGPTAAKSYMEQAYALSQQPSIDTALKVKVLSNMGILLCYLGHVKDGREFCFRAFSMMNPSFPTESFSALNAYVYALTCAEAYQEVWALRHEFHRLSKSVGNDRMIRMYSPSFYLNLSQSAESVGHLDDALTYAEMACDESGPSSSMVFLIAFYIRQGWYEKALQHVSIMCEICFSAETYNELKVLARAIEILGWVADVSGQSTLAKRCVEKAELYFGQLGQWDDWLKMRDYQFNEQPPLYHEFVWGDKLNAFLDNLTLLDGVKLMFPDVFRMGKLATELAVRMYKRLADDQAESLASEIRLAGRLSFIGLNALAVNESDVKQILLSDESCIEMTQLGLTLLESYLHTEHIRALIAGARLPGRMEMLRNRQMRLASECLAISLYYVQAVELRKMKHMDAVQSIFNHAVFRTYVEPLKVFASDMILEGEGLAR